LLKSVETMSNIKLLARENSKIDSKNAKQSEEVKKKKIMLREQFITKT
jgi:hypothetical protein